MVPFVRSALRNATVLTMLAILCCVMAWGGELHHTFTFDHRDLRTERIAEYDVVHCEDLGFCTEVGEPHLPVDHVYLAVPAGSRVTGLTVGEVCNEELRGRYTILPTQRPRPLSRPGSVVLEPGDPAIYGSDTPYPQQPVALTSVIQVGGVTLVGVQIFPLAYRGASSTLVLREEIEVVINYQEGVYPCPLPNYSEPSCMLYQEALRAAVANPEGVNIESSHDRPVSLALPDGDYSHVIITDESLVSSFAPLVDWHKQKGVPDTIVAVQWIHDNYAGSSDADRIRAFIADARMIWGTMWVLLGGDTGLVPVKYRYLLDESVPGDTYYADYNDDYWCEVSVGRASVDSPGQAALFVGKVIDYERSPPLTDYGATVLLMGFDLDENTPGENCKESINNMYIPEWMVVNKVYDSYSGNHRSDCLDFLGTGQNLANHIDHASTDFMGTGCINHGWGLYPSDMAGLDNGSRQTALYSIGCWANAFDQNEAISEYFVRNDGGGGVGFIGNTRYGWYSPGSSGSLSMKYDKAFFKSIFYDKCYHLGEALSDSKNDNYPTSETMEYIFYELCLLGEPELPLWTKDPQPLIPDYKVSIPLGSQSFTVWVEDDEGEVRDARVCVMKEPDVYAYGLTNSYGKVTLTIEPTEAGVMTVTITARDHLLHEGICFVGGPPDVQVTLTPDVTTVPRGGRLGYTVEVTNQTTVGLDIDYWTDIYLWTGDPYTGNPVFGPRGGTLPAGKSRTVHIEHKVPNGAPLQTYTCCGRIGVYPDDLWNEDCFQFTVVE